MALIICPECNSALSEHADKCPTCGCSKETIQRLIAERSQKYAEYKQMQEKSVLQRAEYEWDCYVAAISEAAEDYNEKNAAIEEKYKGLEI